MEIPAGMKGFKEIAADLGVHWRTVRRWWESGKLDSCNPVRTRSGKVLLDVELVRKWYDLTAMTPAKSGEEW